jgi:methylenetetrahydrofolate dehydrogenase (NAD+)
MSFEECLNNADIIISGVPSKSYKAELFMNNVIVDKSVLLFIKWQIHQKLIKEGAICINFSSDENFDASIKLRASVFVKSLGEVKFFTKHI